MTLRPAPLALLVGLHISAGPGADAGLVTVTFSGEMTFIDDPGDRLHGAVVEGAPFMGSYLFDPDTLDSNELAFQGFFESAVRQVEGSVAGLEFRSADRPAGYIALENSPYNGTPDVYHVSHSVTLDGQVFLFEIWLFDQSRALLANDELAPTPPLLSPAVYGDFRLFRSESL